VAECGRAEGDLFVNGRKPWCQPDLAENQEVVEVIKRCPSGALSFQCQDGDGVEQADPGNTLHVTHNGPYFLRGQLQIQGAGADQPGLKFRAALCRCGQSKNKPFCDNSHEAAGFRDSGAVGKKGEGFSDSGGLLRVEPQRNGPLKLEGNLTIYSGSGRSNWHGTRAFLCRCGNSKNKPFCDGSHKKAGFLADGA
jgi:CDGSH-type Zn-finger protein